MLGAHALKVVPYQFFGSLLDSDFFFISISLLEPFILLLRLADAKLLCDVSSIIWDNYVFVI